MSGDVPISIMPTTTVWPLVRSGKLRALAVAGSRRSPLAPEVPTLKELGYASGASAIGNYIVLAPAATPEAILDLLHRELGQVFRLPAVREQHRGRLGRGGTRP